MAGDKSAPSGPTYIHVPSPQNITHLREEYDTFCATLQPNKITPNDVVTLKGYFEHAMAFAYKYYSRYQADNKFISIESTIRDMVIPMLERIENKPTNPTPTQNATVVGNNEHPTFAQVLGRNRNRKNAPKKSGDHALIIKPKAKQANTVTNADLDGYVDFATNPIKVNRKRDAKDGAVVVGLETNEDVNELRNFLSRDRVFQNTYDVVEPKKRNPRLIIRGVPATMSDENIIEDLVEKNGEIGKHAKTTDELKRQITFKFHQDLKDKDGNVTARNVIIEVRPELRKTLIEMRRMRISWQMLPIEDYILVTRCFKCCGLGHRAKHTRADGTEETCQKDLTCTQCGGNHKYSECRRRRLDQACCPLCDAENKRTRSKRPLDTRHNAMNNACPMLIRYKESEYNRTDYGC